MNAEDKEPQQHEFREVRPQAASGSEHLSLDDLNQIKMEVTAHLGTCSMTVREVLGLRQGSVVPLDKLAGEMTDIYVNGLPVARGEVVVIADDLHVRIGEIVGQEARAGLEEDHDDGTGK
jgi:flagellar motor switch protein FliN